MSDLEEPVYPSFGTYAFDQFVIEKWDVSSTLSKLQQKRALLEQYIALGRYGRNMYFQRAWSKNWDAGITDDIPQDLCSKKDQYRIGELAASVLWIRTWYGNKIPDTTGAKASSVLRATTRSAADANYLRLWRRAFLEDAEKTLSIDNRQPEDEPEIDGALVNFIFDDDATAFGVSQDESLNDIVHVGKVPPFLVSVLMRCPDIIDGMSSSSWREHDPEKAAANQAHLDVSQRLLLMVADREACVEGWVYLVAVNHKGIVLPTRCRGRATRIQYYATEWFSEGVPLSEASFEEDKDTIIYEDSVKGWDDW